MLTKTRSDSHDRSKGEARDLTDTFWDRLTDCDPTETDKQEIMRNLRGFYEVLLEWSQENQHAKKSGETKKNS